MDILIKGMEMPSDENHSVVLIFGKDGFEEARDSYSALKIEGITAVALPEHGDLIDRKALSDAIGKVITDRDRMIGTYDTIEQIIDEAETIVEATE